ncbi:MAG: hypothetical protein CMJ83_20790 [Planctomycetes bacterium]|nr:hypothetical protein [Planctomycetota bacterium]
MRRIAVLILISTLVPIAGAQVRPLSNTDLCQRADRVVVGGVNKLESRWEGNKIVTDVTIMPTENLKGSGVGPFVVTIPGGTVGAVTLRASEAPRFTVGETVVLFLKPGSSPCDVYGWHKGKYTIVNGTVRELVNTSWAQFRQSLVDIIENL